MHRVKFPFEMKQYLKITLINLFLAFNLISSPVLANESSNGIWSAIGEYISQLAGNIDYVNIASEELGIDDGLIAQVIFGSSRVVERNPESTSLEDRYLVKDKVRIGLRLGAGFVLAGTASYVRQYTLVYPVKTKAQGVFHNKFLVNFLLPLQVAFDKLPKKYVLMMESFIEGQGRIKIGGTPLIPLGSTTSLGRVQLTRNFIDNKTDTKIKVFQDSSKFTRLAQDLSFSLGLVGIPIYEGRVDRGNLERKYLEIDISNEKKKKLCRSGLKKLLKYDSIEDLKPISKIHTLNSKFIETYNYFTLAWLFTVEGISRADRIIEQMSSGDRTEYVTRYQVENRKSVAWTTGIDGEVHTSKLWAMARGVGENGYIDPEVRISLIAKDGWLKENELKKSYLPLVDRIAFKKNFLNIDTSFTEDEYLTGQFQLQIDFHLYEEAFEKLLNTSSEKYWAALAKVSSKSARYFKDAAKRNYHHRLQRRMRQDRIPLKHLYLAKSMKAYIRRIEIAKKEKDPLAKMHWLVLALRKLTYVTSDSFSPEIFQIIHGLVGTENLHIRIEAMNLVSDQALNLLHNHKVIVKKIGTKRESKNNFHHFYFQDASEIYYLF